MQACMQASAGALERMEVHTCASMPRALAQAASHGWHVIGAALQRLKGTTCMAKHSMCRQHAHHALFTRACTVAVGCAPAAAIMCLWQGVASASLGAGSEASATDCRGFKLSRPAVLVVGSEGRGLRPVCQRLCEVRPGCDHVGPCSEWSCKVQCL